jgi:CheY-like chemotaxis protein
MRRPRESELLLWPEMESDRGDGCMGQTIDPRRVALIVEDDFDVRGLAAALLEETDLRVIETTSAEEALDYLREHGEDVAFLFADIRLPCLMSGVDLARTVRIKWPWVRTVLTSGLPPEEGLRDVRFMPKPWRALEVLMEAERAAQGLHQN